ncbi:ABC transporter substrate-binding protein, partial [Escherichia coli]
MRRAFGLYGRCTGIAHRSMEKPFSRPASFIKAVYQGAGVSAKNLIPPTMWGYNDDVQDYTYDPEKAKALLKEAGLEKGF